MPTQAVQDNATAPAATPAALPSVRAGWGLLLPMLSIYTLALLSIGWLAGGWVGANAGAFNTLLVAVWILGVAAILLARLWNERRRGAAQTHLLRVIQDIENGALAARSSLEAADELRPLAAALNRMIAEVQQRIVAVEAERNGLKAILSAMEDGVVVVDASRKVLIANAAARRMLQYGEEHVAGRALQEVCREPELLENVARSITTSEVCSFEFELLAGQPGARPQVLARCAPYQDQHQSQRGAVVVLHDISELRKLERMRSEFVANVSHELRTPLTSLLGYLETLQDGGVDDAEEAARFVQVCRRQAERLSRIVEDLLRLSRLESPQQLVHANEIDLGDVVAMAVENCKPLAEERGIALSFENRGRRALISGDRGLLVQGVSNLIENAINYNRENGKVVVRLDGSTGRPGTPGASSYAWEIAVTDSGIGIPQDALARIFERFYRVDKARSRERGGTGLGLAIVKHIAHAHGASVHVESELEKGSTFYLRFKGVLSAN